MGKVNNICCAIKSYCLGSLVSHFPGLEREKYKRNVSLCVRVCVYVGQRERQREESQREVWMEPLCGSKRQMSMQGVSFPFKLIWPPRKSFQTRGSWATGGRERLEMNMWRKSHGEAC